MIRALLDTDVILDLVLARAPFVEEAVVLFDAIVMPNIKDYANAPIPVFSPPDFLKHLSTV